MVPPTALFCKLRYFASVASVIPPNSEISGGRRAAETNHGESVITEGVREGQRKFRQLKTGAHRVEREA
jgi:hypothetical protein